MLPIVACGEEEQEPPVVIEASATACETGASFLAEVVDGWADETKISGNVDDGCGYALDLMTVLNVGVGTRLAVWRGCSGIDTCNRYAPPPQTIRWSAAVCQSCLGGSRSEGERESCLGLLDPEDRCADRP